MDQVFPSRRLIRGTQAILRLYSIAPRENIPFSRSAAHFSKNVLGPAVDMRLVAQRRWQFLVIAEMEPWRTTPLIKIADIVASRGYSQLIPASGSTRCRIAARQISTTSSLRRFAKRPSLTNFSIAQKQIAPTMQIIKIPIRSDSMATSCAGALTCLARQIQVRRYRYRTQQAARRMGAVTNATTPIVAGTTGGGLGGQALAGCHDNASGRRWFHTFLTLFACFSAQCWISKMHYDVSTLGHHERPSQAMQRTEFRRNHWMR
jgi:hypothetical protein